MILCMKVVILKLTSTQANQRKMNKNLNLERNMKMSTRMTKIS